MFEHGSSLASFRGGLAGINCLQRDLPQPTFALFSLVRQCDVRMNEIPMVKQLPIFY